MLKKLIINDMDHETRVALIENCTIAELFIERRDYSDIAGNIYKGRVQRVLPGMQAAFVDIGLSQAAFIYVDDVLGYQDTEMEQFMIRNQEEDELPGDINAALIDRPAPHKDLHIEDLITEGQEILVHVAKSPMGTKGARVTTYISLPGRFLVMMPYSNHIGVSRRILDEEERSRLKEMVLSLRDDAVGYIVRTASEGIQREKLAPVKRPEHTAGNMAS